MSQKKEYALCSRARMVQLDSNEPGEFIDMPINISDDVSIRSRKAHSLNARSHSSTTTLDISLDAPITTVHEGVVALSGRVLRSRAKLPSQRLSEATFPFVIGEAEAGSALPSSVMESDDVNPPSSFDRVGDDVELEGIVPKEASPVLQRASLNVSLYSQPTLGKDPFHIPYERNALAIVPTKKMGSHIIFYQSWHRAHTWFEKLSLAHHDVLRQSLFHCLASLKPVMILVP